MKKVLLFTFVAIFIAACNSNEAPDTATAGATMPEISSPYPIGYSSKFEMGDPKNAEAILKLWKIWESGDLSATTDIFADSVTLHLADGSMISGPKDSVIASGQAYRNTQASSVSTVDVVTALKSIDKNENWGLIWGKEVNTDKQGKVDSSYLHEAWKFNSNGKIDLMYQFRAAAAPPAN